MASSVLESIEDGAPIRREVHHDLESFGWAFIYAVYKNTLMNMPSSHTDYQSLVREFQNCFAKDDMDTIITFRLRWITKHPYITSALANFPALQQLVYDVALMIYSQTQTQPLAVPPGGPAQMSGPLITYEAFEGKIEIALRTVAGNRMVVN